MKRAVIALTLLTILGRILITPRLTSVPSAEGSYEAFAHMFVGGLLMVGIYDRHNEHARTYWWLGWALGIYELIYFLVQKAHLLGKI
jgi:hypothetical protein